MTATALPSVEVTELGKRFGRGTWVSRLSRARGSAVPHTALDGVGFRLLDGDVAAVVGPNGAGKSTLLRVLATLVLPDEGRAAVAGLDVRADDVAVRRRVAYAGSDDRSFPLRLTARESLQFFAALHGVVAPGERIEEVLSAVGLRAAGETAYAEYSTGMRQRLALARALLGDARVLLLDEPFRGLDEAAAADLAALVSGLAARGATALVATHHLEELSGAWTRVLRLEEGRLVFDGAPADYERRRHLRAEGAA